MAVAPAHAVVMRGRDLAAALNQRAVGIKEKLRVVESSAVPFIDANRHNNPCLLARFTDGLGGRRRNRYRLIDQLQVLASGKDLVGGLDEGEIRVIRHNGLGKRDELHALLAKFLDFLHDLVDRALAAIKDWTQLHCCCFHNFHHTLLYRSRAGYRGSIVRPTYRENVSMIASDIASAYSSSGKWPPSK